MLLFAKYGGLLPRASSPVGAASSATGPVHAACASGSILTEPQSSWPDADCRNSESSQIDLFDHFSSAIPVS